MARWGLVGLADVWGHFLLRRQHDRARPCASSIVFVHAGHRAVGGHVRRATALGHTCTLGEQHHQAVAVAVTLGDGVGGVVHQPEIVLLRPRAVSQARLKDSSCGGDCVCWYVVDGDRVRGDELGAAPARVPGLETQPKSLRRLSWNPIKFGKNCWRFNYTRNRRVAIVWGWVL